jgi:hypothetical protein
MTEALLFRLGKQGIPWEVFEAARKPVSGPHDRHLSSQRVSNVTP